MSKSDNIKLIDYSTIVNVQPLSQGIKTELLFCQSHKDPCLSPIDEFLENSNALNKLWVTKPNIEPILANVIFQGYFSAVESYIRALVRALVKNDHYSLKIVESKNITFGAALHHNKNFLPEALMDTFSFVSSENIIDTFRNLIDIKLSLDEITIKEFDKICELRHCCVHRFGKLGAKNAMALGLNTHGKLFEKPLKLKSSDLQDLSLAFRSVVKTINNCVYKAVLDRTYSTDVIGKGAAKRLPDVMWKGTYNEDKTNFKKYYKIFSSKIEKSPSSMSLYNSFIEEKKRLVAKIMEKK